jgi:hypothetical protein
MANDKYLTVQFSDGNLQIKLYDNPLAEFIHSKYKHLKNLPLNLNDKDIFFNKKNTDINLAKKTFTEYAKNISITVDTNKLNQQDYLNYLHEIYEKNFDGKEDWLKFHEHIHILETLNANQIIQPIISFDYRTLAGRLQNSFKREYYKYSTVTVKKNQCFLSWQELAKPPYYYYLNKEPNDIKRLCELSKPWVTLKTSIHIACDNINFLENIDILAFNNWFAKFKDQWCEYWGIPDWDPTETFKVIPIGEIEDADRLVNNIKNNNLPLRIS